MNLYVDDLSFAANANDLSRAFSQSDSQARPQRECRGRC